jgi:type VI secretion system protein ImpL
MSAFSQQLKKILLLSALVALTGIAILMILILSEEIGPVQIILIALILLLWPIGILFSYYRRRRQAAESAEAEIAAPEKSFSIRASRIYEDLERRADETAQWLQQNLIGGKPGAGAVYQLPWFLMVGAPASGKTSLLLSAGLSFNALPSQRRADQNLLRPTGNCEWRLTDQAVWIDTAGRYQTEGQDRDEWLGLVDTLKKVRKKRPIDGLVVTVNAYPLLTLNEPEIEQQAQVLRARLDELIAGTGARFPVYLVFTQADLIPGFAPFFRPFNQPERAQVWGATIPLAQTAAGPALFDTEFDYLLDSLMRCRMLRLSAGDKPAEQLQVFDFPLYFNQTRRKLGLFTMALFRQSRFSEAPLFRGFYFSSCPAPQSRRPNREDESADGQDPSRINNPGFFAEDLFREVLLRDKDLAASFQETQAQPNRHRKLMLAAAGLAGVALLWTLGMLISFSNNRTLIELAETRGSELLGQFKPNDAPGGNQTGNSAGANAIVSQSDLNSLNSLLDVMEQIDGQRDGWIGSSPYRFGLYSGDDLRPRLREIYFDFVSQRFLSPALIGLSQHLDQTTPAQAQTPKQGTDREQLYYDMLKAYKMSERQAYVEPVFLREQLARYWKEPATLGEKRHLGYFTAQAGLSEDDDHSVPRPKADDELVRAARGKLQSYAVEKLVYSQIIRGIEKQGQPYYLRDIAKGQFGSQWIENAGSQSVPYAFTKQAYYKHVQGAAWLSVYEDLKEKNENDYVLDRKSEYARVEPDSLRTRYEDDYVNAWQKFLDDLRIKNFDRKKDAVEALEELSRENSAFQTILRAVSDQTILSKPPASEGLIGWLKSLMMKKLSDNSKVETDFASLKTFNIGPYLGALKEVQKKLIAAPGDEWRQVASLKDDPNFQGLIQQARELLGTLKSSNAAKSVAALLGRPLDNIDVGLGKGLSADLGQAWSKVLATARQLEAKYPFSPGNSQVQAAELKQFLNPVNGELSQFYERIKGKLDGDPGQIISRNPGDFSDAFLSYLNGMLIVRNALFPKDSDQPKVDVTISLKPPSGVTAEIILGDTSVRSEGGVLQQKNASWPSTGTLGVTINRIQDGQTQLLAQFPDTWGLFKMLSNAKPNAGLYGLQFGGVQMKIQAPSNDPFQTNFARLRAPQTYQ